MRARERLMIHQEMRSEVYGDVIFPLISEVSDPWGGDCCSYGLYHYKKETRDNYFTEIRNILNSENLRENYRKTFIESFYRIKRGESPDEIKTSHYETLRFEWLNIREVKEAIKKWEGDPLDILYYLTHAGIIETAVRNEYKRMSRK
jgi:hypothetical protein